MADIGADVTQIRIASYPLAGGTLPPPVAMLQNPGAMFTGTTAALIQMEKRPSGVSAAAARAALWAEADGWDGADGPRMELILKGTAAGEGKETTSDKAAERRLMMPMNEEVGDSTEFDKLTGHLFRGLFRSGSVLYPRRIAMGFRRDPVADSRFLLGLRYRSGLDRRWRGNATRSKFRLRLIAEWGWAVTHHTAAAAASAGPFGGLDEMLYGFFWGAAAPSGTSTVSIDGTSYTISWPVGLAGNSMLCPSPPFRFAPAGVSASPALPLYLRPGSANIVVPAGVSMFWCENYSRV